MAIDWNDLGRQEQNLLKKAVVQAQSRNVAYSPSSGTAGSPAVLPDPGDDLRAEVRQRTQRSKGGPAATLAARAESNNQRNQENSENPAGRQFPAYRAAKRVLARGISTPMLQLASMIQQTGGTASGRYTGLPDPGDDLRAETRQLTQLAKGVPADTLSERARVNGERNRAGALAGLEWERQDLSEQLGTLRRDTGIRAVRQGMSSPAVRADNQARGQQMRDVQARLKEVQAQMSALQAPQTSAQGNGIDGMGRGVYDGDVHEFTPLNWENELQQNLKRRIDRLSPDLSEKSRVEAVDAIILEEAKKLQQKYRTVYSASASFVTPLFSPGLHKTLKPLYTEYPTEETESNPIIRAAGEGLKNGFSLGLWTEAFEGIYPQRTQSGVRGDAEILGDVAGDAGKTAGKLVTEGAGKTTLADWADNTGELAKTAPIKIPENATIKSSTKAAGYDQISYKWSDSRYSYEVRWHTKTPGAPAGQGNTWVVSRVTRGNPSGQRRVIHIMVGNTWVTRHEWQAAITAYQNGTMTETQEAMLKAGHWFAP